MSTLPAVTDSPSTVPAPLGAAPLRNPKHERFARARSLLMPKAEAYRYAGFACEDLHAMRGNASRLERGKAMAARVAFLCRQDEEVLKAKRLRLEEFLWTIHEVNYADFWETVEEPEEDEDGEPTGKLRKFQKLKTFADLPIEHQNVIQSLKYTEKGRPILELYSKIQANMELRKLLGLSNVSRDDGDEYSRLADMELIAELRRQAQVLGISVDLTYRFNGADDRAIAAR